MATKLPQTARSAESRDAGPQNLQAQNAHPVSVRTTFALAMLGSLLVYAGLPPWNLWPIAWVATVPWLLLVRLETLPGKHPYARFWLAGFAFWMASLHWLRLPHWTTYFGWLALSMYLAVYLPVFVGLTRVAVHQLRISLVVAAPIVWTGLELARGHLLGGFTMASLSHTQLPWLPVIQAADVIGDYGISGLIVLVSACVARCLPWQGRPWVIWPVAPLVVALAAAVGYGQWRLSGDYTRPGPAVALIQGSIDAELKMSQGQADKIFEEYRQLSERALRERQNLDLLVWPETMFRFPMYSFSPGFFAPPGWLSTPQQLEAISLKNLVELQKRFGQVVEDKWGTPLPPSLLLGVDAVYFGSERAQYFNSALFVDPQGNALARYDKMHPVMFGEYIPLADFFPVLYRITPLTGGLTAGIQASAQKLGGVRYAPNICYETVIPHLIRGQVLQLKSQGEEPDVLVNLTNDGWFRGSSELDMHLACGVFRAIEMRKPLLVAANTGFSAWVDSSGRIVEQGPRRAPAVLIAQPRLDTRTSLYLTYGDWFSSICLLGCLVFAAAGAWRSWSMGRPDQGEARNGRT